MSSKTVLIGLGGATFTALDPPMERGVMPFLRDFVGDHEKAIVLERLHTPGYLE